MTTQLDLWSLLGPPPSTADPHSRAAARSMTSRAGSLRRLVAEYIADHGPVASWAIEEALLEPAHTVTARIWELRRAGMIDVEGEGVTPSGRRCGLYVITDLGRLALAQ